VPAIADTSAVLAAIDRKDPAHEQVTEALRAERSTVVLPIVALPEIAFLLERRHGAVAAASAVGRLVAGPWPIECPAAPDLARAAELMTRYADARIGFVDAAIVAIAERLGATRIYTLDHRHFAIVRPRHVDAFEVLPPA
jgi:hypothetical protein